jgi:hypothetical protein
MRGSTIGQLKHRGRRLALAAGVLAALALPALAPAAATAHARRPARDGHVTHHARRFLGHKVG